ncbi:MAG: alpha/beta hydrolase [Candidatus Liptonbacteria bacterium]|nr:alpha/beta hydrolase [Candidatus Liptonbacteria bacterium]
MLCELTQIKTKDGLRLEGLVFEPTHSTGSRRVKVRTKTIALWLSGLTGRFSGSPERIHAVAGEMAKKKISFAIFNHRGFGNINSLSVKKGKKSAYKYFGTSFEKFEDSVLDIEAMIGFCRKRGYKKIFLLGHSTGANKSLITF